MALTTLQIDFIKKEVYPNLVDTSGPFPYFADLIYRLQMKDNEGNLQVVYVVQPDKLNMTMKKNLPRMTIVRGMGELARNLAARLAKVDTRHANEVRKLDDRIEQLEKKIKDLEDKLEWSPRRKWTFAVGAAAIVGLGGYIAWITATQQFVPDARVLTYLLYGLFVAAATYVFGRVPKHWLPGEAVPEAGNQPAQ